MRAGQWPGGADAQVADQARERRGAGDRREASGAVTAGLYGQAEDL